MKLYDADSPDDDEIVLNKKRWYREQLESILRYQEVLNKSGLSITLNPKKDFYEAAHLDDSVGFLTRLITDVSKPDAPQTYAIYDNHFTVLYSEKTGDKSAVFYTDDLQIDYLKEDGTIEEQGVIEKVKSAMLLAHTAKAAGWTNVNFQDTKDPLSRYILKMVCNDFGLKSDKEEIDESAIPAVTLKNKNLQTLAFTHFNLMKLDPNTTVARAKHAYTNSNEQQANNNNNDSFFDFDIAS